MIHLAHGNLLTAKADALVNTVNTMGAMGKGIALQFKKAFPENYAAYAKACKAGEVQVGRMFVTESTRLDGPRFLINFPTKKHWRFPSSMAFIEQGLAALVQEVRARGIRSIAIPPLGCGLGGLPWAEVKARIEDAFADLPDVDVYLYAPAGAPDAATMPNRTTRPKLTHARAAFLGAVDHYQKLVFIEDPSLLEVQKIAYFLQEVGEPLKLKYQKWTYGPYADNLRHVLAELDGHYLTGWGDGANKPGQKIAIIQETLPQVEAVLKQAPETKARFDRVAALVEGFESPYGMELLGTAHWVIQHELPPGQEPTVRTVAPLVQAWTKRKANLFSEDDIGVALEHLKEHGLAGTPSA